eukprot:Nk52_evm37s1705 gene=Nk52_evmTU37s1705
MVEWSDIGVVCVIGCTGVGKSQLGIELAGALDGEIVSADSMQVYKGLDIVTNKVTREEQEAVRHYGLDLVDTTCRGGEGKGPGGFTVVEFRDYALRVIEDIARRGKVPIIVGGTNYYIQAVVWKVLIEEQEEAGEEGKEGEGDAHKMEYYYEKLREVDPLMAEKLHRNDVRKIKRSLEVYEKTGIPHSEHIMKQRERAAAAEDQRHPDSCSLSSYSACKYELRFPRTCFVWIDGEQKCLDARMDARVGKMLEMGLLEELMSFRQGMLKAYDDSKSSNNGNERDDGGVNVPQRYDDFQRGLLQNIGLKEFEPYLSRVGDGKKEDEVGEDEDMKALFEECVEGMKRKTRQYSRQQIKWIKKKFIKPGLARMWNGGFLCKGAQEREQDEGKEDKEIQGKKGSRNVECFHVSGGPVMYIFDASDIAVWNERVRDPALEVVTHFIQQNSRNPRREVAEENDGRCHDKSECMPCVSPLSASIMTEVRRREIEEDIEELKSQCSSINPANVSQGNRSDSEWKKYTCASCDKVLNGAHEYQVHLKSRKHRNRKKRNFKPTKTTDETGESSSKKAKVVQGKDQGPAKEEEEEEGEERGRSVEK